MVENYWELYRMVTHVVNDYVTGKYILNTSKLPFSQQTKMKFCGMLPGLSQLKINIAPTATWLWLKRLHKG